MQFGDVVKLKAGGPEMTVIRISNVGPGWLVCLWFQDGKPEAGCFPPEDLMKSNTREDPVFSGSGGLPTPG